MTVILGKCSIESSRLHNYGCFQIVTKILGSRQLRAGKKTKTILPNEPTFSIKNLRIFLTSFNAAALIRIIMSILLPIVDTLHVFAALLAFRNVSIENISNILSTVMSLQSSFSIFFQHHSLLFGILYYIYTGTSSSFLLIYGAQ